MRRSRPAWLALALLLRPPAAPGVEAHVFEEGVASWYGKEFAGRPTASGEMFDPEGLTAAHRTLPFGTMVLVTDLGTSRCVQLRINDRGPFVKGRILDCSAGGARALGFLTAGTARVQVEILGQLPSASDSRLKPKQRKRLESALKKAGKARREIDLGGLSDVVRPVDPGAGPFAVQVGAFADEGNASRLARGLVAKGFDAQVVRRAGDPLSRVRVGPVPDRAAAEAMEARLREMGEVTFIVRAD